MINEALSSIIVSFDSSSNDIFILMFFNLSGFSILNAFCRS